MPNKYDFLAIGDTGVDAFIRLKDASVNCDINREKCQICMRFADKLPYEDVYVVPGIGNAANASVAAARLGLKSALVSNAGDDYLGKECVETLRREKVGTEFIKLHRGFRTNYHYVLWYEDDRTILIKHEQYPYLLPDIDEPNWIYISSLGGNSEEFHKVIEKYLNDHPKIKVAFQPGTFQIKMGQEKLAGIYKRSDVFLCNKEEAQRILKTIETDFKKLLKWMHDLGPKIVVITDGVKGAYASEGQTAYFMPPYPDPKPPYERTGAGDAFSATFVSALALGKKCEEALMWAPINSMSVVQKIGAREGLLARSELEKYLNEAPESYKLKVI